jgi:hypothetical protein
VRDGSAMPDGRIEWFPVGISQKPTQLPEETNLGDISKMVVCPFKRGWLVTPAVPKNEFFDTFVRGMLGPTIDLVAPGLNVAVSSVLHGGIETVMDQREDAKYANRGLGMFFSLPYLDVLEIDRREMGSFWSLSMQPPVRHLTVVYRERNGERATVTFVVGATLKNWVAQLFTGRYSEEITAANQAVINSYLEPAALNEFLTGFQARHGDDTSVEAVNTLLEELSAFRAQRLAESGVTDLKVDAETRKLALANFERYRGLPGVEPFIQGLAAGPVSASQQPAPH